jgi:hypothetical protein
MYIIVYIYIYTHFFVYTQNYLSDPADFEAFGPLSAKIIYPSKPHSNYLFSTYPEGPRGCLIW